MGSYNSLKEFNTFNLDVKFNILYILDNLKDLKRISFNSFKKKEYVLILGSGSNVLFLNDFYGIIIINRIKGIKIKQDNNYWFLDVYSGELWTDLINFTLYNGIYGLENLSFIPGSVGAAVVNNIGAYGLEIKDFFNYAKILDSYTGRTFFLKKKDFNFSYRNSILKKLINNRFIVIKVGFIVKKVWKPCFLYKDLLNFFDPLDTKIKVEDIYTKILKIRDSKIPKPSVLGNVGSIFKNPVVSIRNYKYIKNMYFPFLDYIDTNVIKNKKKIPAALLIDICGLKGYTIGWAKVYRKQPLIIVNLNNALPKHIYSLILYVRKKIFEKFNIFLELEIKVIDYFSLIKEKNFFKV